MFHPNQWPILEWDDDPLDLVGQMEAASLPADLFPERAVLALLADTVDDFAARAQLPVISTIDSINGRLPVWRVDADSGSVALLKGHLGAPMAVQLAEILFSHGVRTLVAVGSCGALQPLAEGEFLVPARALRSEGTSYQYLPPSRFIDLDADVVAYCLATVRAAGFGASQCTTWTTDALFRETSATVAARQAEGCAVVDMECSALAAAARFRGMRFGQILFTGDTLADAAHHDPRTWGASAREAALRLALIAAMGC